MCVTLTTDTQLTRGSVFITGIVVGSWSTSSVISVTLSTFTVVTSLLSCVDITYISLQEPSSPFSKSMRFCKTTTLITALMTWNRVLKRIILNSNKMITFYRFISLQLSKLQNSSPISSVLVIADLLVKQLRVLYNMKEEYHVQRSFPHVPIRGQKTQSTSPPYLSNTDFQTILWCRYGKLVHMSYLSYLTSHDQRAWNDHTNLVFKFGFHGSVHHVDCSKRNQRDGVQQVFYCTLVGSLHILLYHNAALILYIFLLLFS